MPSRSGFPNPVSLAPIRPNTAKSQGENQQNDDVPHDWKLMNSPTPFEIASQLRRQRTFPILGRVRGTDGEGWIGDRIEGAILVRQLSVRRGDPCGRPPTADNRDRPGATP